MSHGGWSQCDNREITGLIRTEVTVRNSAKSLSDEHVRTEKEKKR